MYILYFSAHTPDICIRFNRNAMTKINNNREIGKALFLSGYSQRDIAARIGVSENTVGRWARDGH
ncbi:MAG: helix-turn-helix domain-containing protein, partial [Bacteroidaceae bacterium]|nr:helix-turn-helix domain-containing protein [Bacteroidaceae bacterium]